MKRVISVLMAIACLGGIVHGVTWQQVDFTELHGGAASYDPTGGNVVVSGRAFYETIRSDGWLGTQLIGGDGHDEEVVGNFAMYGVFEYDDSLNLLGQIMANPTQLLAFEIRARDVRLDFTGNGEEDFAEHFTLNATDMPGVDYLQATFAELSQWGYTQLAPGVWFDLALDSNNHPGKVALSIVIDGLSNAGWDANFVNGFDAYLLAGELQGPSQVSPGSGIRIAEIPEPATLVLLGLGGVLCRKFKRR